MKFNETYAKVKSITNTLITCESGLLKSSVTVWASCVFDGKDSNPIDGKVWLSVWTKGFLSNALC